MVHGFLVNISILILHVFWLHLHSADCFLKCLLSTVCFGLFFFGQKSNSYSVVLFGGGGGSTSFSSLLRPKVLVSLLCIFREA